MDMAAVSMALSGAVQNTQEFVVYYGGRIWSYGAEQSYLFGTWARTSITNLWVNAKPHAAYMLEQSREKALTGAIFFYNNPVPCAIALSLIVVAGYIIQRVRTLS